VVVKKRSKSLSAFKFIERPTVDDTNILAESTNVFDSERVQIKEDKAGTREIALNKQHV
jgi:hypothetical protein